MIALIKAEWQKLWFRRFTIIYLCVLTLTSTLLGIVFSLTTNTTEGRALTELTSMEVITANMLGVDAGTILLVIFSALMIANEFSTKCINVSLAITPKRFRFFTAKFITFGILSIVIGIMVTLLTFLSGQIILSGNGMNMVLLSSPELLQLLVGCAVMPIFYCLLTVCLTFLFQSSAGSISFTLGVMLLPAFITWFSAPVQQALLPIMPRSALHSLAGLAEQGTPEELTILSSIIILAIWILLAYIIGVWKFKRRDL